MSKVIAIIEKESIVEHDDGSVSYRAKFAVDTDGSGPLHGDPDAQAATSLRLHGVSLNADVDRYIVVPPAIIHGVKGVVLGCQAHCLNMRNGRETDCVVGDIGPHTKLGEGSRATAIGLGINPSPTSGGVEEHIVMYTLFPGRPALVNGKQYALQPAG